MRHSIKRNKWILWNPMLIFTILLFIVKLPSAQQNLITINDIADRMDKTIQKLLPITTMYYVSRERNNDAEKKEDMLGFKKLVISSRVNHLSSSPQYREELYQNQGDDAVSRHFAIFDGSTSKGYRPINNTGNVETGVNVLFMSGHSIENFYQRLLGWYIPDILRGNHPYLLAPNMILKKGSLIAIEIQSRFSDNPIKYILYYNMEQTALPYRIVRQKYQHDKQEWVDSLEYVVDSWMTLENKQSFPKIGRIIDYEYQTKDTLFQVIRVELNNQLDSILKQFSFPNHCQYMDMDLNEFVEVKKMPEFGIGAQTEKDANSLSLMPYAVHINLDDAMRMFEDVKW